MDDISILLASFDVNLSKLLTFLPPDISGLTEFDLGFFSGPCRRIRYLSCACAWGLPLPHIPYDPLSSLHGKQMVQSIPRPS